MRETSSSWLGRQQRQPEVTGAFATCEVSTHCALGEGQGLARMKTRSLCPPSLADFYINIR
jgi:hypothetical protein